jgi:integrase
LIANRAKDFLEFDVGAVRRLPRVLQHYGLDLDVHVRLIGVEQERIEGIGLTKRVRTARSLTVEQFHSLLAEMQEPFATLALVCVCLGLRISEALALCWSDVDWLGSRLSIRRGIVRQHVDDCKTEGSAKTLLLASDLLARLKAWKQVSQFGAAEDWVFASPFSIGRLPYSYTHTRRVLGRAAKAADIGHLRTHAFRHTYRSWLDAVGASLATQKNMMRHASITTTMGYGMVFDDAMNTAGAKVAQLAFRPNGAQAERSTG